MSSQQAPEIRASDAEREQTGEVLREATVEGRLTLDEFSERYMQAQQARTRNELDTIVRDLPAAARMTRQLPTSKISTILSGDERTGAWQLAPETTVTAILGGCKLDLRQTTISSEVTTLDVNIVLSSLELIVPQGIDVQIEATMILSGRTIKLSGASTQNTLKPLIRITGSVFLGSITVRDQAKLGERLREVATSLLNPPRNEQRR